MAPLSLVGGGFWVPCDESKILKWGFLGTEVSGYRSFASASAVQILIPGRVGDGGGGSDCSQKLDCSC